MSADAGAASHVGTAPVYRGENCAGQTLDGLVRVGARIEGGEFQRARLRGARLARSTWVSCDLAAADLSGADLRLADLSGGVVLRGARLRGARLAGADLRGSDLASADLTDADLSNARLAGARLTGAKLDRADLRGARGLAIDGNSTAGAKLSYNLGTQWTPLSQRVAMLASRMLDLRWARALHGRVLYGALPWRGERTASGPRRTARAAHFARSLVAPADLWFALKRTYTGPWLFLNLLALLAFFLPRLELGIARISVDRLQLMPRATQARDLLARHAHQVDLPPAVEHLLADATLTGEDEPVTTRVPLWWVLIGLHKGWMEAALSVLLLAYVLLRTVLTLTVSQLANLEQSNGISPSIDHYRRLIWAHLCTRMLMCVAMYVFASDLYRLLQLEVTIVEGHF